MSSLEEQSNAQISEPWTPDPTSPQCHNCHTTFTPLNRRHHCRLCGHIFCQSCTKYKSLIPPSSIVLVPRFQEIESDLPEREITYTKSDNSLLYGRGLEERTKLAREPLRVCYNCLLSLKDVQNELRLYNSNAMRYNTIDPSSWRRLCNSPLAFTLGHEVRKAAYTLHNLLPLPKKMGAFVDVGSDFGVNTGGCKVPNEIQSCTSNMNNSGVHRIPTKLLQMARGIATLTTIKGGMGLGVELGTGLVISKLNNKWSAPCAIATIGISWGALIGAQISDHVFLLMNDHAVNLFTSSDGSIQLGADVGVSIGPIGRGLEADVGVSSSSISSIYTYSLSKGLYAGISLDGKVLFVRNDVNCNFYGMDVHPSQLLNGDVPTPPAAQPLYDALKRCDFYASENSGPRQQRLHGMHGNIPSVAYTYDDGEDVDLGRSLEECYDDDDLVERQFI